MPARKSATPKPAATTDKPHDRSDDQANGRKRALDWEAVERDYRTGSLTLRELAGKHGCGHSAIANRAKRHGWSRDLTAAVRAATSAALVNEAVTTAVNNGVTEAVQTVTNTVLVAAEVNKQVILGHRSDLQTARAVANSLLAELRGAALLAEDEEMLAFILAGEGAKPEDLNRARVAVQKAIGLGSRVSSIKALAEALTKLHAGERQAFGIDDGPAKPEDPIAALLSGMRRSALPTVSDDDAGDA
jgi:hypothetical protein